MPDLARALLERFGGVRVIGNGWRGVEFGCRRLGTSTSLGVVMPYEVEEHLLGERSETETRPPAFPIGRMNDEVMFMREDWSTITVGYDWGLGHSDRRPLPADSRGDDPGRLDPLRAAVAMNEPQGRKGREGVELGRAVGRHGSS